MNVRRHFHMPANIQVPKMEIAFLVMLSAATKCPGLEMPARQQRGNWLCSWELGPLCTFSLKPQWTPKTVEGLIPVWQGRCANWYQSVKSVLQKPGERRPRRRCCMPCAHLGVTSRNICCWCSTIGMMGMKWGPVLALVCFSMGPIFIVDAIGSLGPSGICGLTVQWSSAVLLGRRAALSLMPQHEAHDVCKHLWRWGWAAVPGRQAGLEVWAGGRCLPGSMKAMPVHEGSPGHL